MTLTETKVSKRVYWYIIILFLLTLFIRIVLITYYNSNYGGIEQNVIYGIQRILLGQQLYQDPASDTYAIIQYSPLYYYFTATVSRCFNIDALDVQGIYALCRSLALIFNLLTILTIALIIRSWRYNWLFSFVFAMPVLMVLTSHYYTRGDSMHLFLFVTAFYAYLLYSKNGKLYSLLLAAIFSGGCIMAKQSGILIIGIIGFCVLFSDRKYLSAIFYSLCTFCTAYLIAIPCIHGNWPTFYQNVYLGLKNGIDLSFLYNMFISQFFTDMVPFYVLGGVIAWLVTRKVTDKTFRIVAIGAVLSFLFAVVTGIKVASSNNYFTEFLVFLIIAVPYLFQSEAGTLILFRPFGKALTVRSFAYIAFFILITSKTVGLFSVVYIEKGIKNNKTEYLNEEALYQYMTTSQDLKDGDRILFTDRGFLNNLFIKYAIMPTNDVVSQVYTTNHATYDYSTFISGMNTGAIKYIITTEKKKDINEWNCTIPFILFDKNKFKLLAKYLDYSIYIYSPESLLK